MGLVGEAYSGSPVSRRSKSRQELGLTSEHFILLITVTETKSIEILGFFFFFGSTGNLTLALCWLEAGSM